MIVNGDSGNVNTDSGKDRESVHVQPEQVFTMNRNRCSRSTRMSVHDQPDYAITDALVMALWRRRPGQALLHHSDQGSQYTSALFQRLLELHGIECSLSRRGECWDNAAMESFFSSLKSERLNRRTYRSRDDVRADVFSYIEQFYNPRRRHSTLGYVSPMEYEKQAGFA